MKEINKANLLKEAAVFGVVIMGDGATIHRMPLLNILAMSGTLANYVADMSATCAYVANFSPTLQVDPTRRGLGHLFFSVKNCRQSANKTTTNLMPPKKTKKRKDVVTATAAAADAGASYRAVLWGSWGSHRPGSKSSSIARV